MSNLHTLLVYFHGTHPNQGHNWAPQPYKPAPAEAEYPLYTVSGLLSVLNDRVALFPQVFLINTGE